MARSFFRDPSITQKHDAKNISSRRSMSHRVKRQSNKRDRQLLDRDLNQRVQDMLPWLDYWGQPDRDDLDYWDWDAW